jgi:hypothetical protein
MLLKAKVYPREWKEGGRSFSILAMLPASLFTARDAIMARCPREIRNYKPVIR